MAAVIFSPPGATTSRVLKRFKTIRLAEKYIARQSRIDPLGVSRGDYGIDASEREDSQYQRAVHPKRALNLT